MRPIRAILLSAALLTSGATFAAAQAVVPVQWGWQHRDGDDRAAFRDGYRQGRLDARQGRRADWNGRCSYRENDDRVAFRNGYTQGYREISAGYRRGDGDHDADDGYYRGDRGVYGGSGYGFNAARQYGFQDGLNDGRVDRNTGHSFRPGHDDNYKAADRGYNPRFGNLNQYKAEYRQAYQQGYQQGYNSGVWGRR
ncbi:MAG TPA: hypothetical protein VFP59_03970 [Candidatus Angelobacter sp.]|nr:hypothetical protein [Candidatus Angelobacter sp.]